MKKPFECATALAALFFLILSGCGEAPERGAEMQEEIIPVRVQQLSRGSETEMISATGLFSTDDETILSFKTGGVVDKIRVKQGDRISRGQLLAVLNLTEIDAGARQARLALEKAQRDFDRAGKLYRDSVATLEQMQNARTALGVAREQYKTASFNRSFSEIRATEDGYVLQRFANEGQVVAPGTPVLQVNGAGSSAWLVKVGVSDRAWAAIRTGDKAVVESDALPGKLMKAVVYRRSESIDPASGTFTIFLRLSAAQHGKIASGMFARARIYPSDNSEARWTIPYDALLDGDNGKGYVFVTQDGKTAIKREVSVQSITKDHVQINAGLEGLKYVIVSGSPYLNDGSKIKIQ